MTTQTTSYFYDSYALIEYLNGNKNYRIYFEDGDGILTKLNLMEVYYKVLAASGNGAAKTVINAFSRYLVDFDLLAIEEAMKLRFSLKNKSHLDISYADALGYYLAKHHGLRFLTGDNAFKSLENVEFVR